MNAFPDSGFSRPSHGVEDTHEEELWSLVEPRWFAMDRRACARIRVQIMYPSMAEHLEGRNGVDQVR